MKNKSATRLFAGLLVTATVLSSIPAAPYTAQAASTKTVTVTTQKQLDAALKNKNVTGITIKTSKGVTFSIKSADYGKKTLTVNAAKATVTNAADFKALNIKDAKTFNEKGDSNKINITDKKLNLNIKKQADFTKIVIAKAGSNVKLVTDSTVDKITLTKNATLSVSGKQADAINVVNNAKGSVISTANDANITLNKAADVTVKKGAVIASLTSNSDAKVKVEKGAVVNKVVVNKNSDTAASDSKNGANIDIQADGQIKTIDVKGKASVDISGKTDKAIKVVNNASGSTIATSAKTELTLNKKADVAVEKGAVITSLTAKKAADIKVEKGATVNKVTVGASNESVNIVADGVVKAVNVNKKANVSIEGATGTAVQVTVNAKGANVTADVKTDFVVNVDANITLKGEAEGSQIVVANPEVKVEVENHTKTDVDVVDKSGTVVDTTKPSESTGDNSGNTGDNSGSTGDNSGSTGDNTGDNSGSTGDNNGDNSGSTGDNTGDNSGSTGDNTGDNSGSTGDNTGDNSGSTGGSGNTGGYYPGGGSSSGGSSSGGSTTPSTTTVNVTSVEATAANTIVVTLDKDVEGVAISVEKDGETVEVEKDQILYNKDLRTYTITLPSEMTNLAEYTVNIKKDKYSFTGTTSVIYKTDDQNAVEAAGEEIQDATYQDLEVSGLSKENREKAVKAVVDELIKKDSEIISSTSETAYDATTGGTYCITLTKGKGTAKVTVTATFSNTADATTKVQQDMNNLSETATGEYGFTYAEGDMAGNITADFTLPLKGENGSSISWVVKSGEGATIDTDTDTDDRKTVKVTRPAIGEGDSTVKLTATFSIEGAAEGSSNTKEFTFTIKAKVPAKPVITTDPVGATYAYGDGKTSLSIEAECETDAEEEAKGTLGYQWKCVKLENSDTFDPSKKDYECSDIEGATSKTYDLSNITNCGKYVYVCEVTNTVNTVKSEAVVSAPVLITVNKADFPTEANCVVELESADTITMQMVKIKKVSVPETVPDKDNRVIEYAITTDKDANANDLTWHEISESEIDFVNGIKAQLAGEAITFSSLTANTTYYIYARVKETENYLGGGANVLEIATKDKDTYSGNFTTTNTNWGNDRVTKTSSTVSLPLPTEDGATIEYAVSETEDSTEELTWISEAGKIGEIDVTFEESGKVTFSGLDAGKTYYFFARVQATETVEASEAISASVATKKENTITFTQNEYKSVYDEAAIEPNTDFSALASNGEVTYSYYAWKDSDGGIQDNTDFSAKEYSNTVPQNAGTYIIKASVAESEEYSAAEAYAVIVITKKAYEGELDKTLNATANGLEVTLDVDDASGLTLEYAYATTDSAPENGWQEGNTFTMPEAGSYYFFARVQATETVEASTPIKTDAVKVLNLTVITFGGENTIKNNIVYDGSPIQAGKTLTGDVDFVGATVADTNGTREPSYSYYKLGEEEIKDTSNLEFTTGLPTNAGKYVIKATFAENKSYEAAEATIELTIGKASYSDGTKCQKLNVEDATIGANSVTFTAPTNAPENVQEENLEYEYAFNDKDIAPNHWQKDLTFNDLMAGMTYYFFVRIAESDNYTAGAVSDWVAINFSNN